MSHDLSPRIDAHHHLWKYDPGEYSWIDESMKVIRRDYLAGDIEREIQAAGIHGVVTVQARQSVEETEWLLGIAREHDFVRGVVGWAPLRDANVEDVLGELAENPKLKAIRHVVQGEEDPNFLLGAEFNQGIQKLLRFPLVYDILVYERQLPQVIPFVDLHPNQTFVLDHIAKPRIKDHLLSPWRENIRELARRQNVYCKLSGMVTEADYQSWTEAALQPYFDVILEAFEPKRLMFGSDWPVCLVAAGYGEWLRVAAKQIEHYSAAERELILGGTAAKAYRL